MVHPFRGIAVSLAERIELRPLHPATRVAPTPDATPAAGQVADVHRSIIDAVLATRHAGTRTLRLA